MSLADDIRRLRAEGRLCNQIAAAVGRDVQVVSDVLAKDDPLRHNLGSRLVRPTPPRPKPYVRRVPVAAAQPRAPRPPSPSKAAAMGDARRLGRHHAAEGVADCPYKPASLMALAWTLGRDEFRRDAAGLSEKGAA